MSFSDYLPSPTSGWDMLMAPFKKREGQPWLQGTARNIGQAAFGDKISSAVNQNVLGDPAPGQLSSVSGTAAGIQPQAQLDAAQSQALQQMLQQLMQKKGGLT